MSRKALWVPFNDLPLNKCPIFQEFYGLLVNQRGFLVFALFSSGGTKRDRLKGTNARNSQFFADFRRFLLIFAFPGNYSILEAQIFAANRRKPQIFAENRRKPQIFAETRFSHLVCPF